VRTPRPMSARYLVIWFTRVPAVTNGYQGGVTNLIVRGTPS